MKVIVLSDFADKSNFKIKYEKGQVVEFSNERARELIERNLVKENKEQIQEEPVKRSYKKKT